VGSRNAELGMRKWEVGSRESDCGLTAQSAWGIAHGADGEVRRRKETSTAFEEPPYGALYLMEREAGD